MIFSIQLFSKESLIMKVIAIVMAIVLLTLKSSSSILAGGHSLFTETNSPEFQKVLAFAKTNHPSLKNLTPTAVYRQLVNGFNYRIIFEPRNSCSVEVKIYSTFNLQFQQTSYFQQPKNCHQNSSPQVKQPEPIQPISIIQTPVLDNPILIAIEQYKSIENWNDPRVKKVHNWLIARQKKQLFGASLKDIQIQQINGVNYKLIYTSGNKFTLTYIIFSTYQEEYTLTSLETDNPKLNNSDIQSALASALLRYPSLSLYKLLSSKVTYYNRSVKLYFVDNHQIKVKIVLQLKPSSYPQERSFDVMCLNSTNNCNDKIALNLFNARESLVRRYRYLTTFSITNSNAYQRPNNIQIIIEVLINKTTMQSYLVSYIISKTEYKILNYRLLNS